MPSKRSVVKSAGSIILGTISAGCNTGGSDPPPTSSTQTTHSSTVVSPEATTHPFYAQCPSGEKRILAQGDPLTIAQPSEQEFEYVGPPTQRYLREKCIDIYSDRIPPVVNERVDERVPQYVRGDELGGEFVIAAYLVFDYRTPPPPIRFNMYREVAPSSLNASIIVNNEPHDCSVPVEVRCSRISPE